MTDQEEVRKLEGRIATIEMAIQALRRDLRILAEAPALPCQEDLQEKDMDWPR